MTERPAPLDVRETHLRMEGSGGKAGIAAEEVVEMCEPIWHRRCLWV